MADQLVLSPAIDLSPHDVITAWNADPTYRSLAELRISSAEIRGFDLPLINTAIEIAVAISTPVAINVVSSAVYDLIKTLWEKQGKPSKHIHIETIDKPDKTHIVVVDIDEQT